MCGYTLHPGCFRIGSLHLEIYVSKNDLFTENTMLPYLLATDNLFFVYVCMLMGRTCSAIF